MNLQDAFLEHIKEQQLFQKKDQLLLAVSGGCDSMVLAHLCLQSGYQFSIAHCNFQLRGAASDAEEELVTTFANQNQIPLFVKKFDVPAYEKEFQVNTQVAARELRYAWFASLINTATRKPFDYILTAHHSNDNMETVLMNFFKGTGLKGLTGIATKKGNLVRPLLFASRKNIEAYAAEHQIAFLNDASNGSDKYSRNFIRNTVLPLLKEKYPAIENNIENNIARFNEIALIFNAAIAQKKAALLEVKKNEIHIPIHKLLKEKAYATVLYECIKDFGFTSAQMPEILKLLAAQSSKYISGKSHQIIKNRNWLILTPLNTVQSEMILISATEKEISFTAGLLQINAADKIEINKHRNMAFLDASKISFPLILRRLKIGDYFYPLGMQKKKKISRFLIDEKFSKTEKEKIWVLESDKKIIWVVGHRIDDRLKVKETTKRFIQFLFVENTI